MDSDVTLLFTRKGISETIRFTPASVYEEYGFTPAQVTDWKGLAGDSSDNIPGINGIGDKTAVKLLQKYGTLENILAHAGDEKGKLSERLSTGAEQARMCRELATIRRDAPVDWHLADCAVPDWQRAIPALKRLGLNQLIRRIQTAGSGEQPAAAEPSAPARPEPALVTEAAGPEAISGWLAALTEAGRPLALQVSDAGLSLFDRTGRLLKVTLGGDLLSPGLDPVEALRLLGGELADHPAIVHDGKRLLHMLADYGLELPERFDWDTMLGAYLLNPQEKSYALSALFPEQPEDACTLAGLADWQRERVTAEGMLPLMQEVELPLCHVLFHMEQDGFMVDAECLRRLGTRWTTEIDTLKNQVYTACGVSPFNLNSPQQLSDVLFEQLQLPHGKKTSRGYSTAVEVLEDLRDIAPEVIEPLLRYRQLVKLNGTYIEGLLRLRDGQGRVHSYFDQVATATGRISSSEPNLQNIPVRTEEGKLIREAFLPRPGWVLVDADYSQIELRLMAHFSGDAAMVEAFTHNQDVHARTASEIFDVPLSEVTPTLRSRAKAVNFGLIYGISAFGLARNTRVSRQEAEGFIRNYFLRYPGVRRFMDNAAEDGKTNGYAITLMGRRRYLPELSSPQAAVREFGKRAAMNTPVQGTAADIIKLAMVRVEQALRREGMRSRLILQVHDELLLECPPEEAERAAQLLKEAMEGVITLRVPLVAEVHTGASWAEAK